MKPFTGRDGGSEVSEGALEADALAPILQVVARDTSDSVIITDPNFIIQWVNTAATHITGYSIDELRGRNLLEMAHASSMAPDVEAQLRRATESGSRFAAKAWTLRKNGERMLADFEMIPHRNDAGEVTALIGITRDITQQANAEKALRESEEHLRDAHRLMRAGTWRYFLETQTIHWSDELMQIFRRPKEKGQPSYDEYVAYINPSDRDKFIPVIRDAITLGKPYEITFQVTREDGSMAHLHGRGNVRRNETGQVIELYGTTQDITERVAAEKERLELHSRLASAQRLESLGVLAGGIAHDFNNLLMGVMMTAGVLEREIATNTSSSEAISSIQEAARRMADLTNQLLAYAGRGRFVVERVDPNIVTANMIDSLRKMLHSEVTLDCDIMKEAALVEIDPAQLRHVIASLLTNASEALEGKPGTIQVLTRVEKPCLVSGCWTLEVTDSGVGMSEDVQQRIFEPFFSTKPNGRGLGLSTVHGLVRRSRGTINVHSEIGKGTRFTICLPLIEQDKPRNEDSPKPMDPIRPIRVLVADDEAMVRRSLRRMLERYKMQVAEATDGRAALDALNEATEPFDLILLDLVMPRMTGYEVLADIRLRKITTKVILMSGFNSVDEINGAKPPGCDADAMLQKPFAWDELRRAVQTVLGNDDRIFANNE